MIKIKLLIILALVSGFVFPASADNSKIVKELLLARNNEFREEIIRVSDKVYTAVGYGTGPVSMIIGDDGLVIIDTNLHVSFARPVFAEFRKITDKPVKAIVFTHGHGDHTMGAPIFMEVGTQIWARSNFGAEDKPMVDAGVTIMQQRAIRHGGAILPEDEINHIGVSRRWLPGKLDGDVAEPGNMNLVKPTHTFDGARKSINVAGLKLELVAAGGETADQLYVWYEADRVLFSGDNFYKSWPNLYAIRGTTYRNVLDWINSLSSMLEEKPRHLVGGHTRPIIGEAKTTETLTNYRDAIKYVFDKTIEGMNKGLVPNELVEYAKLPDKYRELDYLRPYYGHPDWAVRSIFGYYLGWFDGNPTNLFPLAPIAEAEKMAELSGGRKGLEAAFKKAVKAEDYQWALQLADHLLVLSPNDAGLALAKAEVLDAIAERRLNATARNYYRTVALELRQAADR